MRIDIKHITEITNGVFVNDQIYHDEIIEVYFDTRTIKKGEGQLFVALKGSTNDGHNYIQDAYKKGVRNFLIEQDVNYANYTKANFIKVESSLRALQELASSYRKKLSYPIIGITGSNGKTIVKEWLAQALSSKYQTGKSPLSYNSQLGVPLSILRLNDNDDLGIIEAGISQFGEMKALENIIKPNIGIFTTIGDAHSQGFENINEKIREKLTLFSNSEIIIYNNDNELLYTALKNSSSQFILDWGRADYSKIKIESALPNNKQTELKLEYKHKTYDLRLPFTGDHNINNAMHVISYLLLDNWSQTEIQNAIDEFRNLPNRLELKNGINNSLLINDAYSADLVSLQAALANLETHNAYKEKIVFLSDFDQQHSKKETYTQLENLLSQENISEIILIGIDHKITLPKHIKVQHYPDTDTCLQVYDFLSINKAAILVKGSRVFRLEQLVERLAEQIHQTCLETKLSAITHNLNVYKSYLKSETKIMAVIKAEAYGSGSHQLSSFLVQQDIDYIAVALIDEAVNLRRQGCQLPIMVFNVQESNLNALWTYNLEPEVYSLELLNAICISSKTQSEKIKIHLKVDSGMNRLGFTHIDIAEILELLNKYPKVIVESIFSHLAASEDSQHDEFTKKQFEIFDESYTSINNALSYTPFRHILNTAGIIRFPKHQYNLVRLGIGLYGLDTTKQVESKLERVHKLSARILQIKELEKNDTTGYSRAGKIKEKSKIAIISIGYADGLIRKAGNGNYKVSIHNKLYPTIGHICMDVSMIDITGSENIFVGDEVIIFDANLKIEKLAEACDTISYEIISRIAPRVKRTYVYE